MKKTYSLLCLLFLSLSSYPQVYIITTIAGTGHLGARGPDGSIAKNVTVGPSANGALKIDDTGNLYYTEGYSLRKIDTSGILNTIAGIYNMFGYSGDGGPAISAKLDIPSCGIPRGSGDGYIYIADAGNNVIRRVSKATGVIYTVYGKQAGGFSGDGGMADTATFTVPSDIVFDDSGNLYIADRFNWRVRKVNTYGIVHTVVGTGARGSSGDGGAGTAAGIEPQFIALDKKGNLFISDSCCEIRKIDAATGIITRYAGTGATGFSGDGGPATSALLHGNRFCLDTAGDMYISDGGNHRIRKVDANTGIITTIAGNDSMGYSGDGGLATNAKLFGPVGITADAKGNIYVADYGNFTIRKLSPIDTSTYVHNISEQAVVAVYPNPATDRVTIYGVDAGKYNIADIMGRQVLAGDITTSEQVVDVSVLPQGTYILRLYDLQNNILKITKLVKR